MRSFASLRVTAPMLAAALFLPLAATASTGTMGATLTPSGAVFRVWAPFADSVHVAGTFNAWDTTNQPLTRGDGGVWSAEIDHARTGDAYKYVIRRGTEMLWRTDPMAQSIETNFGNAVLYDPAAFAWSDAGFAPTSAARMIIYEMHIGTFHDPNPADETVGTFQQAIARLPYLADLGVNMLKVLPVAEFPNVYSWGYNPAMHAAVEHAYGGPDGFKAFVDACHTRNIGVILDIVHNHWDAGKISLWRFDGWHEGDRGGIYFYQDPRGDTPWGPRPDYGRPEVCAYIWDTVEQWLTQYRVNGLRWDATAYMRNAKGNNNDPANDILEAWQLLQDANAKIDALTPPVISIAEDMKGNPWMTKATADGGAGFDSQWDSAFVDWVRPSLEAPEDNLRNMHAVRDALTRTFNTSVFERVIFTESHDAVANGSARVPSKIAPASPGDYWARKRASLGAALVLSAPGMPMLFQGQEFLEDGFFSDRDPLDWSKTNTFAGVHALYRDLIALRLNASTTTAGLSGERVNVHHLNEDDKVIGYHRWHSGGPGDDVIVIANFANRTWQTNEQYRVGLPHPGAWHLRLNSDDTRYGADNSNVTPGSTITAEDIPWNGMPHSGIVALGPYSALILSQ